MQTNKINLTNVFVGALVSVFALGAMFSFATPAKAQTVEELQAMINTLMAQIAALSGGSQTPAPTMSYDFGMVTLKQGSTGASVMALQNFLNAHAGAMLTVDGNFGSGTKAAVMAWQASKGLSADGLFGAASRAAAQAQLATVVAPAPAPEPEEPTQPTLSGEEASLEDFKSTGGSEDEIQEGEKEEIAVFKFDVEDADVMVQRMDLSFVFSGTSDDDEPWDAFEEITLMADGEEIASVDVSDEDDWLEESSPFVFRFSNLDYVVEEGDIAEISVHVEAKSSVDDADLASANEWGIYVDTDAIRATDAAGIFQYIGDPTEFETFDIVDEAGDEDVVIKSSSSNPDAATLKVDDNGISDEHMVFAFKLEAEESDIALDTIVLEAITGTEDYQDVVNDLWITIDGQLFDDVSGDDENTNSADLTFDIDEEFTIDADDTVDVIVYAEFKREGVVYSSGETFQVGIRSVGGEGVDDVSDTSTLDGEAHILSLSVADVDVTDITSTTNEADDTGFINFKVKISADDDEELVFDIQDNANVLANELGLTYEVLGSGAATATLVKLSGDAVYAGTEWTIEAGEDATFALDFTVTGIGSTYVELQTVAGTTVDEISPAVNLSA
jgi:hypothetical protein